VFRPTTPLAVSLDRPPKDKKSSVLHTNKISTSHLFALSVTFSRSEQGSCLLFRPSGARDFSTQSSYRFWVRQYFKWIPGAIPSEANRPGLEANRLPPKAVVRNEWSYTSSSPHAAKACRGITLPYTATSFRVLAHKCNSVKKLH